MLGFETAPEWARRAVERATECAACRGPIASAARDRLVLLNAPPCTCCDGRAVVFCDPCFPRVLAALDARGANLGADMTDAHRKAFK